MLIVVLIVVLCLALALEVTQDQKKPGQGWPPTKWPEHVSRPDPSKKPKS